MSIEKKKNDEFNSYKESVKKQVEKLKGYFAKMGISFDFNQEIKIPNEGSPLSELFIYISLIQDNLRNLDEENKNFIKQLGQEVKDTSIQLIQAEKMSALGELTASILHELNQPLNNIKIIGQIIIRSIKKNSINKNEIVNNMESIVGQIDKMAGIMEHMRYFISQSDQAETAFVDINEILDGIFQYIGQQFYNHGIDVKRQYKDKLPLIKGDPISIEQVFLNLIINARNALDESGKPNKILFLKTGVMKNNNSVFTEVIDNGSGIPEEKMEKIFDPFYTTKEKGKGTGLGLSISKKIINKYNGKLIVSSKVGEGSNFKVIFPYKSTRH